MSFHLDVVSTLEIGLYILIVVGVFGVVFVLYAIYRRDRERSRMRRR